MVFGGGRKWWALVGAFFRFGCGRLGHRLTLIMIASFVWYLKQSFW